MEKNYIIWNGFNTSENNILIEQLEVPSKPEERKELITIDGRNGYLTRDYDCFSPISYEVQLNLYNREQVDVVKKIFRGSGDLVLSRCPDVTYKATIVNSIDFERIMYERRTCVVTFELQPLAYINRKITFTIMETGKQEIINQYNAKAYPYMKIYGSGSGNLYFNNEIITFTNIDEYVELDSELEECYKDTSNCNKYMIGNFPVFNEGTNEVDYDGGITYIEITPRWRTL